MNSTSPTSDALQVAVAKLDVWDEEKAAELAKLRGAPCPLSVADFGTADFDASSAAGRIQIN